MFYKKLKKQNGFTFLELLVAIFILSVGTAGVLNLISQLSASARFVFDKMTAAYLAQEGIEITRNIRDSNWIAEKTWDQDIGLGDWEVDYQEQSLGRLYGARHLNVDANGFYSYSSGIPTKFTRKINIQKGVIEPDNIQICVTVDWTYTLRSHSVYICERIYNWRR